MVMTGKKSLYVFGNNYLDFDSLSLRVAKLLGNKAKIVKCSSPDALLEADSHELTILDVVKNSKEPLLIRDVNKLKSRKIISMHDFDLAFFLKLMDEMGIKRKIKIIGIPSKGDEEALARTVKKWI